MHKILKALAKTMGLDRDQEAHWVSAKYRTPHDPVFRAYAEPKLELIQKVMDFRGKSVLDVGCGPGNFTLLLSELAGKVTGCDSSVHMLSKAAELHGVEIIPGDATNLPFDDDSFDICFEANLLHHTDRPDKALAEMARVARQGMVLIEPNISNPLMLGFSLLVQAERGGLKFTRGFLNSLVQQTGARVIAHWTTGMISQNNTPAFMVPILKIFDRDLPFAEYQVLVAGLKGQEYPP